MYGDIRYAVVLADCALSPTSKGLPGVAGIPWTVPFVSGRAPDPFWFLSLSGFAPGCRGVGTPCPGTPCPGTAGPGTVELMGVAGVICST